MFLSARQKASLVGRDRLNYLVYHRKIRVYERKCQLYLYFNYRDLHVNIA